MDRSIAPEKLAEILDLWFGNTTESQRIFNSADAEGLMSLLHGYGFHITREEDNG